MNTVFLFTKTLNPCVGNHRAGPENSLFVETTETLPCVRSPGIFNEGRQVVVTVFYTTILVKAFEKIYNSK